MPELRSYEEVLMQHLAAVQAGLRRGARSLAAAPFAFLPLMLAGGCGVPEGRDGVEDIDALRPLSLVEELRLGSVHDPDEGFARVTGATVDRDGRLYVFEGVDLQFRVYGPEGREISRFGGRGEGPGEFARTPTFGVRGDTVWTVDGTSRRITHFDREGRLLATGRLEPAVIAGRGGGTVGVAVPWTMREDGHFLGRVSLWMGGQSAPPPPPGPIPGAGDTLRAPVVRYSPGGSLVDTLGWYPLFPATAPGPTEFEFRGVRYRLVGPPGDGPLQLLLDDAYVEVDRRAPTARGRATFRITRREFGGDTIFTREYGYQAEPYSSEYLDQRAWRAVQLPTGGYLLVGGLPQIPDMPSDSVERFRAVRGQLAYPDFPPPIGLSREGSDGTLWLSRFDDGGDLSRWLLFDREGTPLGELALPREHRVLWSGEDRIWVVEPDEFDIPWLVRYRLTGGS